MFHDFRVYFGIVTTHLTHQCPKCLLNNVICVCKKSFKAMCGNYSKTKSEIMKHCQKDHIIFFHSKL